MMMVASWAGSFNGIAFIATTMLIFRFGLSVHRGFNRLEASFSGMVMHVVEKVVMMVVSRYVLGWAFASFMPFLPLVGNFGNVELPSEAIADTPDLAEFEFEFDETMPTSSFLPRRFIMTVASGIMTVSIWCARSASVAG